MAGMYGCPWTNIVCIQACGKGCCKNCNDRCPAMCGVYLHNVGKIEISLKSSQK